MEAFCWEGFSSGGILWEAFSYRGICAGRDFSSQPENSSSNPSLVSVVRDISKCIFPIKTVKPFLILRYKRFSKKHSFIWFFLFIRNLRVARCTKNSHRTNYHITIGQNMFWFSRTCVFSKYSLNSYTFCSKLSPWYLVKRAGA